MSNLTCFGCGGKGHLERDCPNANLATDGPVGKPMWCGRCDRRTRLVEIHGLATRCQECHPLAHQNLAQNIRCPGCRMIVYVWDIGQCGEHAAPAKPSDRRPAREEIDAIVAREMETEERRAEVAREFAEHPRNDTGTAA